MSDESVFQNRLEELERSNERLELENALLESVVARSDVNIDAGDDSSILSVQVLTELCKQEIQYLKGVVASSKTNTEASEEVLRLQIDLAEESIAALNVDAFNFKKDVMLGAQHPSTKKPISEKVLLYFDKQLLAKDAEIKEMVVKSEELKMLVTKAEKKLKSKGSSDIQYIDFHQLQIESQQLNKQAKTSKEELESMRAASRHARQELRNAKEELNQLENSIKSMITEESKVQQMLVDTKVKTAKATSQRDEAEKIAEAVDHENRQKELKHEERLDAMILIEQQVEIQDLERLIKNLERKLEIKRGQ